jgi:hypothetical protein
MTEENFELISRQYQGIIALKPPAFNLLCAGEGIAQNEPYCKAAYMLLEKYCGVAETAEFFKQCGERGVLT